MRRSVNGDLSRSHPRCGDGGRFRPWTLYTIRSPRSDEDFLAWLPTVGSEQLTTYGFQAALALTGLTLTLTLATVFTHSAGHAASISDQAATHNDGTVTSVIGFVSACLCWALTPLVGAGRAAGAWLTCLMAFLAIVCSVLTGLMDPSRFRGMANLANAEARRRRLVAARARLGDRREVRDARSQTPRESLRDVPFGWCTVVALTLSAVTVFVRNAHGGSVGIRDEITDFAFFWICAWFTATACRAGHVARSVRNSLAGAEYIPLLGTAFFALLLGLGYSRAFPGRGALVFAFATLGPLLAWWISRGLTVRRDYVIRKLIALEMLENQGIEDQQRAMEALRTTRPASSHPDQRWSSRATRPLYRRPIGRRKSSQRRRAGGVTDRA